MSGNRQGALKGWCKRKGHNWSAHKPHTKYKITLHFRMCKRCDCSECQEGMGGLVSWTFASPKIQRSIGEALTADNTLLARFKKTRMPKMLDGGPVMSEEIKYQ